MRNKSGFCRDHVLVGLFKQPEFRAKHREAMRLKAATDPVYRDGLRARAKALSANKDIVHRRTRHFVDNKLWELAAPSRSQESWDRAARSISNSMLAWCPPHLREHYNFLKDSKGYRAAEARAMIEDQHELEMARWRRSIGAPVEALEQAEPTISDPFTSALDLSARLFRVTSEQILSAARNRKFTMPRYALAVVLKRQGLTTTAIANKLGKNDHTSALHWIKRGEHLEASERKFAAKVVAISGCWAPVEAAA